MTTISYAMVKQNPLAFARNWGVSDDAKRIREESDEIKQSFARTISFGDQLSRTIEDILRAT